MRAARIRAIVAAVALAIASLTTLVIAQPAQAAVSCTSTKFVTRGVLVYDLPSASGSIACQLGLGNHSAAVSDLQSNLNLCNGQHLTVDGDYGPATQQAVRNVQSRHGIPVDGVYGPQTRNAMSWHVHPTGSARFSCATFPG